MECVDLSKEAQCRLGGRLVMVKSEVDLDVVSNYYSTKTPLGKVNKSASCAKVQRNGLSLSLIRESLS